MTLRQLEVFLAVAGERSFSRAAKKIHSSQPTLSEEASNVLDGAFTHGAVALFFLFVVTFANSMQLLVKDVQPV